MVGSFNPFENKENKKHNVSQYISTISFQSFFKDILLYFLKIQKLILNPHQRPALLQGHFLVAL
jgi:hypothetical protein